MRVTFWALLDFAQRGFRGSDAATAKWASLSEGLNVPAELCEVSYWVITTLINKNACHMICRE